MSINVHVSGNPISINRGKMVTTDLDPSKKEFDKRRLMRLEQVRQQSKDIAEDVRNKVRREKSKQMRQIEREGEAKLRNWQNRKLLELQTQYEEALNEFGLGHREAEALQDESDTLAQQKGAQEAISKERGKVAMTKEQQRRNEEQLKKIGDVNRKKIVRNIEDTRSAMVSRMSKSITQQDESHIKRKKHKASADINITIPDSDSTDQSHDSQEQSSSCDCTDALELQSIAQDTFESSDHDSRKASEDVQRKPTRNHHYTPHKVSKHQKKSTSPPKKKFPNKHTLSQKLHQSEAKESQPKSSSHQQKPVHSPPRDTRISERIKRRGLMASQSDYCDEMAEIHPIPFIESNTKIRDTIDARVYNATEPEDIQLTCSCHQNRETKERLDIHPHLNCICSKNSQRYQVEKDTHATQTDEKDLVKNPQKVDEFPTKPSVKLKSSVVNNTRRSSIENDNLSRHHYQDLPDKPHVGLKSSSKVDNLSTEGSKMSNETSKVQFYDHANKFQYEKSIPTNSYVERIPTGSLQVMPNEVSEAEWSEQIKKREKEAQMRGKQALDKERVRKHYEEMMKKLPLLQKKERIGEIFNDKPEYHMSEERLKEKEHIRQNNLENAFNKRIPNLNVIPVTLPKVLPVNEDPRLLESGSVQSINVAEWDEDYKESRMFTAHEVQEIVKAFTDQRPEDRQAKLKELLKSLKLQREQLIEEIRALPQDDSIDELVKDLRSFIDDDDTVKEVKSRRKEGSKCTKKRNREEKDVSTGSSIDGSSSNVAETERKVGTGKTPRKKAKMKSRRKVLVLQNTSTQTTPKQLKQDRENISTESQFRPQQKTSRKICDQLHVVCDCNKENKKENSEELCQIVIKIKDDEEPNVVVKSNEAKSIGVGTETSPVVQKEVPRKVVKPRMQKEKNISHPTAESSKSTSKTWKDQLSKNSISTTSTSYFSPPDLQRTRESQKSSLYHLRKKPQQGELSSAYNESRDTREMSSKEQRDKKIFKYVEKLLGMARGSIENLSVSTSNVETPSQSVIEMESNNPGISESVYDILKKFPFKISDVAEGLSYSPELSPAPPNTSVALTVSDQESSKGDSKILFPERDGSRDSVLAQYADITDSCSKRIEALAAMIQQLRQEKIQMLQVPSTESKAKSDSPVLSDRDYSTKYMDLPEAKELTKSSSSSSLEEDEVYRRLIEIDLSLAEKLKQFKPGHEHVTSGGKEPTTSNEDRPPLTDSNDELIRRLQQLKEPLPPSNIAPPSAPQNNAFIPFLSDIPKLPKFEVKLDQPDAIPNNHKRPPPSKGLTVARKFNGNISIVPHELSTIVEADSQQSTKIGSNLPSPKASLSFSALKDIDLILIPSPKSEEVGGEPPKLVKIEDTSSPKLVSSSLDESSATGNKEASKSSSRKEQSSSSHTTKVTEESSSLQRLTRESSSSGDDIENIESMLKSIGMEWAIPTLHKTREALALTSSSSSDLSVKRKKNASSDSEVSLRELLKQQLLSKISSSTLKTDGSPASLLGEFSDLSAIHGADSSADKTKRRTSTPVTTSKSTSKSKMLFSADSDLSSVKNEPSGANKD